MNKKVFFQNVLFWLLVGLIIFIPLYPKFPLLNVLGTYVTIRLEDFFISIVLLLWGIYQFKYNKRLVTQPLFQAFALFWFVGFVSLLSAIFISHSVVPHLGLLHWGRRLEYMFLFWVAATTLINRQQVKILFWVFVLATLIVVSYGFGQLFLGFKVVSTVDKDFSTGIISTLSPAGRVNSTFAGHYDLAIYLSYFLITVAGAWFYIKIAWQKIAIFLVAIPGFILLAYTASRISFFGAIAGLVLVLWLLKRRIVLVALILFSIVLVVTVPQFRDRIVATINVNILNKVDKSYTPIKENKALSEEEVANEKAKQGLPRDIAKGESTNYTELEVGRSFSIRLTDEWPRALHAFYKNPLLGTGYSSISLATDNDYLRALGETGVLGFISIAIIFIVLIKHFIKAMNINDMFLKSFYIVIIGIIINVLITALFIDVLEASKVACLFWILSGVAWRMEQNKTI